MKHYHKARLKKLADHLINGKLGHKKFDFNKWNASKGASFFTEGREPYKCGYAGCAIGECPIAFKKDWKFDEDALPVMRKSYKNARATAPTFSSRPELSGMSFFGIDHEEFQHLFFPNSQNVSKYGGKKLGPNAKAESVANNILAFLEKQA